MGRTKRKKKMERITKPFAARVYDSQLVLIV
jgi:hypothetical protein